MDYSFRTMGAFSVIGLEGSTDNGDGFIEKLWEKANGRFDEVSALAKRDESGELVGMWGLMSDFSHAFLPWQNGFSQGLYLAGIQCEPDAKPPFGWKKWTSPAYKFLCVPTGGGETFNDALACISENGMELVGAVYDYCRPAENKWYMYFPIQRL